MNLIESAVWLASDLQRHHLPPHGTPTLIGEILNIRKLETASVGVVLMENSLVWMSNWGYPSDNNNERVVSRSYPGALLLGTSGRARSTIIAPSRTYIISIATNDHDFSLEPEIAFPSAGLRPVGVILHLCSTQKLQRFPAIQC